jgi:1-acyl-sn-glycerol-3-phosphate acyltransferase
MDLARPNETVTALLPLEQLPAANDSINALRPLVFNILWGAWTGLLGLAIPVLWLCGTPPRAVRVVTRVWSRGIMGLLRITVGLRYAERGRANVPHEPCLVVANHESTWETLAALVLFPDCAIVTKNELLRIPVMGWYLKRSPMILIDRADSTRALRDMVEMSRTALAEGRSILIFPEGTRKPLGETIEFKRGVEFLYRTLGVPVVPVVVDSARFWGIGGATRRSGTITVSFLPAIEPGLRAADFVARAETMMKAERNALAREDAA